MQGFFGRHRHRRIHLAACVSDARRFSQRVRFNARCRQAGALRRERAGDRRRNGACAVRRSGDRNTEGAFRAAGNYDRRVSAACIDDSSLLGRTQDGVGNYFDRRTDHRGARAGIGVGQSIGGRRRSGKDGRRFGRADHGAFGTGAEHGEEGDSWRDGIVAAGWAQAIDGYFSQPALQA